MASWYLKFVVVHDLQTREKYYFVCENWLALEKEDGKIDRLLPVACEKQKNEIKFLLAKQTKQKLSDDHLWFSVLFRPVNSAFTRLDRLTCCIVLLLINMLMNLLYFDLKNSESGANAQSLIELGPVKIDKEQVRFYPVGK